MFVSVSVDESVCHSGFCHSSLSRTQARARAHAVIVYVMLAAAHEADSRVAPRCCAADDATPVTPPPPSAEASLGSASGVALKRTTSSSWHDLDPDLDLCSVCSSVHVDAPVFMF